MMKKVYICAPLGGDVQANLERVKKYTEYALKCGTAPVVPHFYALCLDDSIPREREMGMAAEIQFCKNLHVKTRKIRDSEIRKTLGGNCL